MMKILVLMHRPLRSLASGAARVIHDTYAGLTEHGHTVLLVSLSRKGSNSSTDINGFQYIDLKEDTLTRAILLPFRMLTAASREGLSFLQLSIMPKIYEKIPKTVNKVSKIAKKFEPDAVISELIYTGLLANYISTKTGAKFLIRAHNIETEYLSILAPQPTHIFLKPLIHPLEQKILSLPSKVITLSYRDAYLLNKLYNVNTEFLNVPLQKPPDEEAREEDIKKLGLEPHDYILFVGLLHKPNIIILKALLKAAKYLESKSTLTIAVAGSVSTAVPKSKPSNIKVIGKVSSQVLHSLYTYAEVSIAPIFRGSGIAIKLVESLIYGLPTITTHKALLMLPGLKHGENIYVTKDEKSFARDIQTLAEDTQLREALRKGAKKFSFKNLDYHSILRRYELTLQ